MRRSLILTVAAAVSMVLLAMLVPMALLLRDYALEDRLSRAALEVQATETVVSGQDKGAVEQYLARINRGTGIDTTVLYPGDGLGSDVGPDPGEDARVLETRSTGTARVDDVPGGAEILVPVSLSGSTTAPGQTPVIRVVVDAPGLESELVRTWAVLLALGLVLTRRRPAARRPSGPLLRAAHRRAGDLRRRARLHRATRSRWSPPGRPRCASSRTR